MSTKTASHRPLLAALAAGVLLTSTIACSSDPAAPPSSTAGSGAGGASAGANGVAGGASNGGAAGANSGGATGGSAAAGALGGAPSAGSPGASGSAGSGGSGGSSGSSGAGGTGGAGGSAGAPVYDPCPTNGDACRVMPLGDSITDGCCGENTKSMGASYRLELFRLSLNHTKKLTFVGSHESGPATVDNVPFPKHQEGHSGWTIADTTGPDARDGLQDQVSGWLDKTPAEIITLMIGTNDVGTSFDLPNAPKRLGTLLDTITTKLPNALVVVARIVPSRQDGMNERIRTFNDAMPALVKTRVDAGKHLMLVDMYGAYTKDPNFKTTLLANDLHPSDAGYAAMANVWWAAIGDLLPNK